MARSCEIRYRDRQGLDRNRPWGDLSRKVPSNREKDLVVRHGGHKLYYHGVLQQVALSRYPWIGLWSTTAASIAKSVFFLFPRSRARNLGFQIKKEGYAKPQGKKKKEKKKRSCLSMDRTSEAKKRIAKRTLSYDTVAAIGRSPLDALSISLAALARDELNLLSFIVLKHCPMPEEQNLPLRALISSTRGRRATNIDVRSPWMRCGWGGMDRVLF